MKTFRTQWAQTITMCLVIGLFSSACGVASEAPLDGAMDMMAFDGVVDQATNRDGSLDAGPDVSIAPTPIDPGAVISIRVLSVETSPGFLGCLRIDATMVDGTTAQATYIDAEAFTLTFADESFRETPWVNPNEQGCVYYLGATGTGETTLTVDLSGTPIRSATRFTALAGRLDSIEQHPPFVLGVGVEVPLFPEERRSPSTRGQADPRRWTLTTLPPETASFFSRGTELYVRGLQRGRSELVQRYSGPGWFVEQRHPVLVLSGGQLLSVTATLVGHSEQSRLPPETCSDLTLVGNSVIRVQDLPFELGPFSELVRGLVDAAGDNWSTLSYQSPVSPEAVAFQHSTNLILPEPLRVCATDVKGPAWVETCPVGSGLFLPICVRSDTTVHTTDALVGAVSVQVQRTNVFPFPTENISNYEIVMTAELLVNGVSVNLATEAYSRWTTWTLRPSSDSAFPLMYGSWRGEVLVFEAYSVPTNVLVPTEFTVRATYAQTDFETQVTLNF